VVLASLIAATAAAPSRANAPAGRFTPSGGVVTDKETGLKWQQALISNYPFSSDASLDAQTYCSQYSLPGYLTGWRVPTARELSSIIDPRAKTPAWDPVFGPTVGGSVVYMWTSTQGPPGMHLSMDTTDGSFGFNNDSYPLVMVRCVHQ
jgi:hypothetical protein